MKYMRYIKPRKLNQLGRKKLRLTLIHTQTDKRTQTKNAHTELPAACVCMKI